MASPLSKRALRPIAWLLLTVVLAISPRAFFGHPVHLPRGQDARRPHPPRKVLMERAYEVARDRRGDDRGQRTAGRLPTVLGIDYSAVTEGSLLPRSAAIGLSKPDYLRLYEDPHRQHPPPV